MRDEPHLVPTANGWHFVKPIHDDLPPHEPTLSALDRILSSIVGVEFDRLDGAGVCEDCDASTLARFVIGRLILCRRCASARVLAREHLA
jgi:hypothetical protein